ncbi:MAG: CHAT domain-containing protein [Gammaproteobacteria bacterium]|nr:CHAT domain-containing protein [Gammaproteobacteria bacterium]
MLGGQASRERLAAASPHRFRVLAFATHGFKAGEIAGIDEPSLLLAPAQASADPLAGLLTTRQIAALDLNARLVILSACNTATGDGRPRSEAFTGLAQAFLTAGARQLLVTHWPVVSRAAADLTVAVAAGVATQSLPLSVSLKRAVAQVRQAGRDDPFVSHPAYWGPFVAVGREVRKP